MPCAGSRAGAGLATWVPLSEGGSWGWEEKGVDYRQGPASAKWAWVKGGPARWTGELVLDGHSSPRPLVSLSPPLRACFRCHRVWQRP